MRRVIKEYSEQKEEKERSHITETFKQCESFDALEQILQGEQRKWCSRRKWRNGRLQAGFHRICKTLDGHETILSAFPQNNEYTSIFCAALKTVIQVSGTTEEELARTYLVDIEYTDRPLGVCKSSNNDREPS